jgi:hypothetical protein
MMSLGWVYGLPAVVIGTFLAVRILRFNLRVRWTQGIPLRKYLVASSGSGLAVFLVSTGFILLMGSFFRDAGLTPFVTEEIFVFTAALGILTILGSLWYYFLNGKLRESLIKRLRQRDRN